MATTRTRSAARSAARSTAQHRKPRRGGRAGNGVARHPATAPAVQAGVYSAYRMHDGEVEAALATGEDAVALENYFGQEAYAELRELARQAQTRAVRGGPRVLIVPGIMGSKLGFRRSIWDDVVWIDPVDFALGNLSLLALDGRPSKVEALGVVLLAYLKLKLTLQIEGFDADFHPFDWRQPIPALGAALADRIRAEGKDVHLVAHSMGGLVSRAALKRGLPQVKRLVMLGTPNYGSFTVPQALRATHGMVRMVAAVDARHTAEQLAEQVFSSFPGLCQMLPWREKFSGIDLYDLAAWPRTGPRPRAGVLAGVEPSHAALAAPDGRFALIAGINRDTTVAASVVDGELAYTQSRAGDGTVPLALAQLPGVPTYFIDEEHGSLPNNSQVATATIDILKKGSTDRLPTSWTPPARGEARRVVRDADLRTEPFGGRRGAELSPSEVRQILTGFVSPPASDAAAPRLQALVPATAQPATDGGQFKRVVVGRSRQHRLDVTLAQGSITDVNARAYVLGVFKDVDPSGAALAIDQRLGGAISEFATRRMISGVVGETFVMPVGRSSLQTDLVVLAGMGSFATFTPAVQSLVAENLIRLFVRTRIDEFATVLMGAGSGTPIEHSLANMWSGFVRALADTDGERHFRRIVLCEREPERFAAIKHGFYDLASSSLFDDTEVTIDEIALAPAPEPAAGPTRRDRVPGGRDPIYLLARESPRSDGDLSLDVAVLGAAGKATVVSGEARVRRADLEALLVRIESNDFTFDTLPAYGSELAAMVLPANVRALLATMSDRHMVVVHDAQSSRIPWETLRLDGPGPARSRASDGAAAGANGNGAGANGAATADQAGGAWTPALAYGLSRRYLADNLSIAKWLEARRGSGFLDVLLVVDPTETLPGAKEEAERLRRVMGAASAVRLTEIRGAAGTRAELLRQFTSGQYDVVHFAGHAFFDPRFPSQSGILCANREVLSGADLAQIGNLPSLVFFNACEAGRLRRGAAARDKKLAPVKRIARNTSFAEAFLRGGVANYIGTYWPVGDSGAELFARTFYGELLAGRTIAAALLAGRRAMSDGGEMDWADYVHYGSPDFVVKTGAPGAP